MNYSKKHLKAIARNTDGSFVLDDYKLYLTVARNFSNNKVCFRWIPVPAPYNAGGNKFLRFQPLPMYPAPYNAGGKEGMLKHGKWTLVEPDTRGCTLRFACNVCDNFITYYEDAHECDYDYCPNCGAKMDLEE